MTAQGGRAAGFDGSHGLELSGPQGMLAAIIPAVPTEDVRQFE
jgi:hypothetical protein